MSDLGPTSGNNNGTKKMSNAATSSAPVVAAAKGEADNGKVTTAADSTGKTKYEMPSADDCPIFLRSKCCRRV